MKNPKSPNPSQIPITKYSGSKDPSMICPYFLGFFESWDLELHWDLGPWALVIL
jgi:hypothetical protein